MFDFIIKKYHERQLRKIMSTPSDKRIDNWDNIKSIGMIFTVGDNNQWNLIHRFITAQQNQGKEIYLIGFQANKYEIDYIFSHTQTTICHEKEDFTRLGLPKEGIASTFLDNSYDLVIDATVQPNYFGKYITALSHGNLKVGYKDLTQDQGEMEMYDMTIQGNGPIDFKDYIEQIVKYLKMIQKNNI